MAKPSKVQESKETIKDNCMKRHGWHRHGHALYALGFIGAAVYYISTAKTFWMGVLGVLKALVWPAFLVFHLLKFLRM